jgi:cap2 methyltransferase
LINLDDVALSLHSFQNKQRKYNDSGSFFRIIDDNFPEEKYRPRERDEDRTTVHYGQRKLHLSEVEFLTNVCQELNGKSSMRVVLIYAGAAPGNHINLLSEMFPFVKFVLVDPAKFAISETDRIKIYQEFFDNEKALEFRDEYKDYLRLFISDIRLAGPGKNMDDDKIEQDVFKDMLVRY